MMESHVRVCLSEGENSREQNLLAHQSVSVDPARGLHLLCRIALAFLRFLAEAPPTHLQGDPHMV